MEKNKILRSPPPFPLNFADRLKECQVHGKSPAIILTTGSFCPIHKGHIYSLSDARNFIETNFDYKVLAVYISPSNDLYVKDKSYRKSFSEYYLNFDQRCKLLEKTLKIMVEKKEIDADMFFIDKWEGEKKDFISFSKVWHEMFKFFKKIFKKKEFKTFKVFYSLGSDMIIRTNIDKRRKSKMSLLVTERGEDYKAKSIRQYRKLLDEKKFDAMEDANLYYLRPNSKKYEDYSSSLLRDCIANRINYEELIYKEVGEEIERIYEQNKQLER